MSRKATRLKKAKQSGASKNAVHDRRAQELPKGAMVAPVEIDDPYEHGAKIIAFRSIRDNPLDRLKAHDKELDEASYQAGVIWQGAHERAEIGGARAIDPSKEAVDGGRFCEPFSESTIKAYDLLWQARRGLIEYLGLEEGRYAEALIRAVLGERLFFNQVAARHGLSTKYQILAIGKNFKEYLGILAFVYGMTNKRPNPQNVVDSTRPRC